jgi:hypothetical protein
MSEQDERLERHQQMVYATLTLDPHAVAAMGSAFDPKAKIRSLILFECDRQGLWPVSMPRYRTTYLARRGGHDVEVPHLADADLIRWDGRCKAEVIY